MIVCVSLLAVIRLPQRGEMIHVRQSQFKHWAEVANATVLAYYPPPPIFRGKYIYNKAEDLTVKQSV